MTSFAASRSLQALCRAIFLASMIAIGAAPAHAAPSPCDGDTSVPVSANSLRVLRECADGATVISTSAKGRPEGRIAIVVQGLNRYQAEFEKQPSAPGLPDPATIRVFVNGQPIPDWLPIRPAAGGHRLEFDLRQLAGNRQARSAWTTLLDHSLRGHKVSLSVGFDKGRPFPSTVDDFEMDALSGKWLAVWALASIALLLVVRWAGVRGNMLRAPGPEPKPSPGETTQPRKAYSLARTQMAAWFVAVFIAYLLIYLITGALDTITETVLGLMGISAATGFASAVMDTSSESAALLPERSRGFWTDLASDNAGLSLPRLQILAWTALLIFIFARSVYQTLAMPTFDLTLLGLMGISGGTYLGFKKPDQKT